MLILRPKAIAFYLRCAFLGAIALGPVAFVFETGHAATESIVISIGSFSAPGVTAQRIRVELSGRGLSKATLSVARLGLLDRTWRDVRIECARFIMHKALLACENGRLFAPVPIALGFRYDTRSGRGTLVLTPGASEIVEVAFARAGSQVDIDAVFSGLQVTRLGVIAPAAPISLAKGRADGRVRFRVDGQRNVEAELDLRARDVSFSDERGMRAGEGVGFDLSAHATGRQDRLNWQADLGWSAGEVFWNPIYSKAGHRLAAKGSLQTDALEIEDATLMIAGVGELRAKGRALRAPWRLDRAQLRTAAPLNLARAYESYVKPFLADSVLGALRAEGRIGLALDWKSGKLASVHAEADNVSFEDNRERFAVFGAYADVPWRSDAATDARIGMSGAELQRFPIGPVGARVRILPDGVDAAEIRVPLLSGMLALRDVSLRKNAGDWVLSVGAELSPVPLEALLGYFGLPAMQGSISGRLPRLRYEQSTLNVDGALEIEVFNGTIKLTNLSVAGPLGLAPRLYADVEARRLDLEPITRTFSFGHMTGLIDADIKELELSRWQPVRFDARIASSPGRYRKRISQTAVNNISALGGAGAAAAIQRSFLRFFDSFGYSRIGISCRLVHGNCRMGGIEDVPQGYVIVKGGGIPAINVFGYNRDVGWDELLARLRRVIDSNVRPTVR